MQEPPALRLMVVDDQELMRDGLVFILQRQPGIDVVGTAVDGQDALRQVAALAPDVILMDVRMPVMNGIQATASIRQQFPHIQVLMLTTFDDDAYIMEALQVGAVGYILKNVPAQDLADAIRLAAKGIYQLDPVAAARVIESLQSPVEAMLLPTTAPAAGASLAELTPREREVIALVAQGASNREIAEQLVISEGTVKSHISRILSQLGLRDRTQIAVFVHRQGTTPQGEDP